MAKAADKFNLNPEKGIAYLIDKGCISNEAGKKQVNDIVAFFKSTSAPSMTAIGKFFGENMELNQ
jgi:Sec7-like guanine-nucleotide exchange factor